MEGEIREYLAREVPYRETNSCGSKKETLVPWKSLPIHSFSLDDTVLGRVVSDDRPHEEAEHFRVLSLVLGIDDIPNHREENGSIDGHEKTGDIELENPRFVLVVIRGGSHKLFHPRDPERCPLAYPAGVRIVDEKTLQYRVQLVDDEVVNDAVSEVARENLALDGTIDDKSDAFADRVGAVHNRLVELYEVRFVVEFELDGTRGFPFIFSAIVVGSEEFGEIHYFGW